MDMYDPDIINTGFDSFHGNFWIILIFITTIYNMALIPHQLPTSSEGEWCWGNITEVPLFEE